MGTFGATRRDLSWASGGKHWRIVAVAILYSLSMVAGKVFEPVSTYASVTLKPGDMAVTAQRTVLAIDRPSGGISPLTADRHFTIPEFIAKGPQGELYVGDQGYAINDLTKAPTIVLLDPATGDPTIVTSGGFKHFGGLTIDPAGRLYVVDEDDQSIIRIEPLSGRRTLVSAGGKLSLPHGAAVEPDGNIITTAYQGSGSSPPRQIVRIDAATGGQSVVSTGGHLLRPDGVSVAPDGAIYAKQPAGNISPARIIRVDPRTGAQAVVAQLTVGEFGGLTTDSVGNLFAHVDGDSLVGIASVDLQTGVLSLVSQPGVLIKPNGVDVNFVVYDAHVIKCSPRPQVTVQVTPLGNDRLQVSIHAKGSPNSIRSVRLGQVPGNAVIEGTPITSGADASFTIRRMSPGAVTLPFTVTDGCGDWPSFAGGGSDAF